MYWYYKKSTDRVNRNYITKVGSNSVLCQLELPGYYKDDIDIILDKENRELKISADRDDPFFRQV